MLLKQNVYKILSPFSSSHKEGVLDILIKPMNPLINQYHPQLKEYYRKNHLENDQNSKLPNQPQDIESMAQKYALDKQSRKLSKMTRRTKYIRTMKRLKK